MPFLVKEDFKTHMYAEILTEITRGDDTIITKGISAAIAKAKTYLSRYDLVKIFGDGVTEPEVAEEYLEDLKNMVKDMAAWHMVKLANPNVNLELFRTGYEDAKKDLIRIQEGKSDPHGWPYPVDDPDTPENENNTVQWSSNKKRRQHF